jgi:type II secretory pathway pseudopilin PulG
MSITQTTATANRGFTFIGVVVTVTVLAMLAGILLPSQDSRSDDHAKPSYDSHRVASLKGVQGALAVYKIINGHYPDTNNAWQGDAAAYGSFTYDATGYIPGLVPDIITALPKDLAPEFPNATTGGYMYRSDGIDFKFVINDCPGLYPADNPFFDPTRETTAWQISSAGAYNW